ncbi:MULTISPECIES: N,N-dimethylformamidase beta subunit family domain-containing protein [unclassified Nocardioides]|uniref:N,N-dimethylformamidase beta subunit family domain-containing protein n=1 Tax=unclassified Nocardioides TaxID=2615069 RepID=UPI00360C003D
MALGMAVMVPSIAVAGVVATQAGGPWGGSSSEGTTSSSTPSAGTSARPGEDTTPAAGDGADQRRSEPRGSGEWRLERKAQDGEIDAFTTRTSDLAGEPIVLKVSSTEPSYRVSAYRIGAYRGGWGHLVWRSGPVAGEEQAPATFRPAETRTVVAPWRPSLSIDTDGWRPGYYVLKLETSTGWDTVVPYVVRSESARGTVALVAPVTTWQAYNTWGGHSLYAGPSGDRRSWAVSFDRPYDGPPGANDFRRAALPIVVRAEWMGVPLSYFTNVDLHLHPEVLRGASGYASLGHDEYWTPSMRDTVEQARDAGTNLAFLGANTMYWRIRLEDDSSGPARTVVGYRSDAHLDPVRETRPAETTGRFRDAPVPRAEHGVVGMQYECYPVDTDYVIVSPQWWGFRGTGLRAGDRIVGLVGPEADRVYPDAASPKRLEVLSHTSYDCRGVTTTTQSVYYTVPSGAGVFAAGTLRWGCAFIDGCEHPLGPDARSFVRTVTGNLVREFAKGPVGARHPARPNVDRFALPVTNSVDAS